MSVEPRVGDPPEVWAAWLEAQVEAVPAEYVTVHVLGEKEPRQILIRRGYLRDKGDIVLRYTGRQV